MISEPAQARTEQLFLAQYSRGKARYNVLVLYLLSLLLSLPFIRYFGGGKMTMDEAMAQGPHRLAGGLWFFEHCTKLADSLGVHLGWTLEIARETGHVGQQIYNQGADILRG